MNIKYFLWDVDGVFVFDDRKMSAKLAKILENVLHNTKAVMITAASVERVDEFVLSSIQKRSVLKNLSVFAEMGLVELSTDSKKNLEDRITFHLSGEHSILSIPIRNKISEMVIVNPPLYNPSFFGKNGEIGKDYNGKECFFAINGKKFPYLIASSQKRVLLTLEKRRTKEGRIDPRIENAKKEILELQKYFIDQKIYDIEVMETPTSVELKPKGYDKSIPAAMAIMRIANETGKSVEEVAEHTLVLSDTDGDRVMSFPRDLDIEIPFIKIEGEDHTYRVLSEILTGMN